MFTHTKKDFYSVNAEIAIEANQQQRMYEAQLAQTMMQADMGEQNYQQSGYDGADGGHSSAERSRQDEMNEQAFYDQQQQQIQLLNMLQQTGSQIIRYDDVYYPRTDKRAIRGNQYTYEGNKYQASTSLPQTIEEKVGQTIVNQEVGKCPIEATNMLNRGKIYDMKNLKVPDQVRSFNNLYQDSICQSQYHEAQRYGRRNEGLSIATHVNRALFINRVMENAEQYGAQGIANQSANSGAPVNPSNTSGYKGPELGQNGQQMLAAAQIIHSERSQIQQQQNQQDDTLTNSSHGRSNKE